MAARLKTAFRKSRVIAPLHTNGPVAITQDGTRLVTCVGEEVVLTDTSSGQQICRFRTDTSAITSLSISPSSTHLAVFSASLTLRIYELPAALPESASSGTFSDLSQRTQYIQPIRVTAKCHDAPVHVCRIDPSSTLLASGSADGVVKVWDIQKGYVTHLFKNHGGIISALAFNFPSETSTKTTVTDKRFELITGCADTKIRIFDLNAPTKKGGGTARPTNVLEGHVSVPRGLDVSADGRWMVSGGRDSVALVWDLGGGSDLDKGKTSSKRQKAVPSNGSRSVDLIKTIPVFERVEALGILPKTQALHVSTQSSLRFYTGGEKGQMRVWDASTGSVIASYGVDLSEASTSTTEEPREILDVMYCSGSSTLSSLHGDQNIVTFDLPTARILRQHIGYNDEIIDCRVLSQYSTTSTADIATETNSILALATNSSLIRMYNIQTLDARLLAGHTDMVLCLDTSKSPSDSDLLVSGGKDKSARVWCYVGGKSADQDSWQCRAIANGHAESIGAIACSRSQTAGARLMFTGSQDRTIKMWDLADLTSPECSPAAQSETTTLKSLSTLKAHEKDINALDVSVDNRWLASASQDKTVKIIEIKYASSSKKDGKRVAGASGEMIVKGTLKGHKRGVWSVRFSRTERFVATGSGDKTVKLWNLDDLTCLKTFEGHTNTVLRVDFLSAGMQLVSSASDGLVKVWNIKDEECATTLDNHEDKIWALALSSDESTIISAAADSVVTFWEDCTADVLLEKEQARTDLIMKDQDYQNFLAIQDYRSAILLALAMNQPGRLLQLFTTIRSDREGGDTASSARSAGSLTGLAAVDEIIRTLPPLELRRLLTHVRAWNATARTSSVAQSLLHAILKLRNAADISAAFESPRRKRGRRIDEEEEEADGAEHQTEDEKFSARKNGGGEMTVKEMIDGLIPYTERHLARADQLVQDSFVVDYILAEMDMGLAVGSGPLDYTTEKMEIS